MNKDQFTIRKPDYLENFEAFQDSESLRQIAQVIEAQIRKKGSKLNCLDSMAGTGIVGRKMRELFGDIQVIFQDKSSQMLAAYVYSDQDSLVESDAASISFPGASFDIIMCRGGLNNVGKADYLGILKEYIRLIKIDGRVVLQDHFVASEEEKRVINSLEKEVAILEGREDETYSPTIEELTFLIEKAGGEVVIEQSFKVKLSLRDRFIAKSLDSVDFSRIEEILKNQIVIQYQKKGDNIIIVYPIFTITFKKRKDEG